MFWASKIFFSAAGIAGPLVNASTIVPGLRVDARYFSDWNFVGHPVSGYQANVCLLTREAAKALAKAQASVAQSGLSLLAFDCYRPQRAVSEFMSWVSDEKPAEMREFFFPAEEKSKLIERGYIAEHSGHSRGSTIDLTLVGAKGEPKREPRADCRHQTNLAATGQLDMGTTFDCFSELAHTANPSISEEARRNRLLLKSAMELAGFVNYPKEWWHFTLKNEPYKDKYFDFPVQ